MEKVTGGLRLIPSGGLLLPLPSPSSRLAEEAQEEPCRYHMAPWCSLLPCQWVTVTIETSRRLQSAESQSASSQGSGGGGRQPAVERTWGAAGTTLCREACSLDLFFLPGALCWADGQS